MRPLWVLRLACPVCGEPGVKAGWYRTAKACRRCGRVFEKEPGYFAGAIYPFYGLAFAVGLGGFLLAKLIFKAGDGAAYLGAAAAVAASSSYLFHLSRTIFLHTEHRFFRER